MESVTVAGLIPDKTIERLLTEGDLKTALDRIGELMKAAEYNQEIWANLKGQYESALKEKDKLAPGEFDRTANRIREQVYSLIRVMTKQIQPYLRFQNINPLDLAKADDYNTLREYLISKLEGKYRIDDKKLGEGSTCLVFRATEKNFDRRVVLRVLKIANVDAPKREVMRCLHLKHRNVMMVYEAYFTEFPYFVITEYVSGKCLDDLLVLGRRPFFEVKEWLLQLGDALDYLLEKRIHHTHIRPSKILLDAENQPVISPFEVIRASRADRTKKKILEDSLYLPPELLDSPQDPPSQDTLEQACQSPQDLDAVGKSEQFSLAALAFELLTGVPLFSPSPTPRYRSRHWDPAGMSLTNIILTRERFFREKEFRQERLALLEQCYCPPELIPILERMLDKDPQDRFEDMSEFRRALSSLDGTDNELQNIVAKSIARCRRYSKDFVNKFYQKVQYGGHFPADYVQFSDIENQHKMFNGVLNLLMEYEHDHQFFHKLSGMKAHTQLAPKHYEIFLDLLLETVSEYDSQWNKIPAVPAAWNTLRDRVLERLKK